MKRNYENEIKWRKEKYCEIRGFIDKKLAIELKETLKKDKISIASWISQNAKNYLERRIKR